MALDTRQTCWTPSGRLESWQCRKINHPGRGLIKVPSVQHLFKRPLSRPLMQYRSELSAVGFEPKAIIRLRPSELDRQNGPSFSSRNCFCTSACRTGISRRPRAFWFIFENASVALGLSCANVDVSIVADTKLDNVAAFARCAFATDATGAAGVLPFRARSIGPKCRSS